MYSENNESNRRNAMANAVTTIRSIARVSSDLDGGNKTKTTVNATELTNLIYAPHISVAGASSTASTATVNLAQIASATIDGTKCYIAAAHPFTTAATPTYNYALVNQAASYKCDMCSLSFSHIAFLTSHKRTIHNLIEPQHQQQQPQHHQLQATAVPVSGDNRLAVVSANGQITVQLTNGGNAAPQIQIVNAPDVLRHTCDECGLSYASQNDLKSHKHVNHRNIYCIEKTTSKCCSSCGTQLSLQTRKDGLGAQSSLNECLKCDACFRKEYHGNEPKSVIQETELPRIYLLTAPATSAVTNVSAQMTAAALQATNSSAASIKFESLENVTVRNESIVSQSMNATSSTTATVTTKNDPSKPYPVKKRGAAHMTKCHKCNGSGVIFIGGSKNNPQNKEKPFRCNICNSTFSRYSSLWSHKRLHTGEKNFHCSICGISFAKAAYLKNHQRIHTGEKPYQCNVCGMQFSQSPHLKNHERIHSGERPYVCEVCDKSFARHSTLWNHRRIHTGEKPYICEICNSRFNQATHLKNHSKVHSTEKPFRCDLCLMGFTDRFALKRHKTIHAKYAKSEKSPLPEIVGAEEVIVEEMPVTEDIEIDGSGGGGGGGGNDGGDDDEDDDDDDDDANDLIRFADLVVPDDSNNPSAYDGMPIAVAVPTITSSGSMSSGSGSNVTTVSVSQPSDNVSSHSQMTTVIISDRNTLSKHSNL